MDGFGRKTDRRQTERPTHDIKPPQPIVNIGMKTYVFWLELHPQISDQVSLNLLEKNCGITLVLLYCTVLYQCYRF